ncbi:pyridoxal phosphate-dependent aminotransferase [Streptomyces sp. NPDC088729]|uniref:pyridoxal phosphate-dependent aminotransferase n=1 Tax=Streptomyces sp. NPDC088729 TaxID=3365876 RepID=UPI0037F86828
MRLFASVPQLKTPAVPDEAREMARHPPAPHRDDAVFLPHVDAAALDVFARARDPRDPFELRDLWLGRVEHALGADALRPGLAERWRSARPLRTVDAEEVLGSRATVRMVKELFNWFFRDDLYGALRERSDVILSGGSVSEEVWGLPGALKQCVRYALDRDWYGYSDSRGRAAARSAVAGYENARIEEGGYDESEVAITMGGTAAISSLADLILTGPYGRPNDSGSRPPVLCAIPNYPPLVETSARRHPVRLVPLPSSGGRVSLAPLIEAIRPDTPMVLLQTAGNPTGAAVAEDELAALIRAAAPSCVVVLDECHEWLGPERRRSAARRSPHVVRVSSLSKAWSAPGLKVGWILADRRLVDEYHEYASTAFGGPPSFFYTVVEVLARMERWMAEGLVEPGAAECAEFEAGYRLRPDGLRAAYRSYRLERRAREESLRVVRAAAVAGLEDLPARVVPPLYSINATVQFPSFDDSYLCFRRLLHDTGVSVFPGVLTFYLGGGPVRVTTSRPWDDLALAFSRLRPGTSA